ncbi:hypothetical protein FIBSPDRAFT_968714 [Athelia psychrophila]|uniref:Uncharacterized protein n=1 Tax=Athelia psychrophila TaxID=1759441 RepID=A0A167UB37_9AGAM|nr:hypothetical protein FIBSPDRAFT_968714 [Fibularhizoctonia sp. CBS 109695]
MTRVPRLGPRETELAPGVAFDLVRPPQDTGVTLERALGTLAPSVEQLSPDQELLLVARLRAPHR